MLSSPLRRRQQEFSQVWPPHTLSSGSSLPTPSYPPTPSPGRRDEGMDEGRGGRKFQKRRKHLPGKLHHSPTRPRVCARGPLPGQRSGTPYEPSPSELMTMSRQMARPPHTVEHAATTVPPTQAAVSMDGVTEATSPRHGDNVGSDGSSLTGNARQSRTRESELFSLR